MKKIILCGIIILALFFIVSCKDDTEQEKNTENNSNPKDNNEIIMEDWYFFRCYNGMPIFDTHSSSFQYVSPVKINPISKNVTYVCLDALCDHYNYSTDCPFTRSANYLITGNYIFYQKGAISRFQNTGELISDLSLCVYDMTNGAVRQLAEYKDQFKVIGGADGYCYYFIEQYDHDPIYSSEETSSMKYILYRADAKTGKIIEMPLYVNYSYEQKNGIALVYPTIHAIIDKKIYWYCHDENKNMIYYTTDLEGENRVIIDFGEHSEYIFSYFGRYYDGYFYYTTFNDFDNLIGYEYERAFYDKKLYRIAVDGIKESELISESVITYVLCGDKIYYTKADEKAEFIDTKDYYGLYPESIYNWSGGKIYVMNSDGTDKKLLCETGYNLSLGNGGIFQYGYVDAKTINGIDYVVWSYTGIRKQEGDFMDSYSYAASPDTVIINASTGAFTVVSMPDALPGVDGEFIILSMPE